MVKTRPEQVLADDAHALRLMGQATKFEYAERVGCSVAIANRRLRRLAAAGLAERFRLRGAVAYTYTTTVRPGEVAKEAQ